MFDVCNRWANGYRAVLKWRHLLLTHNWPSSQLMRWALSSSLVHDHIASYASLTSHPSGREVVYGRPLTYHFNCTTTVQSLHAVGHLHLSIRSWPSAGHEPQIFPKMLLKPFLNSSTSQQQPRFIEDALPYIDTRVHWLIRKVENCTEDRDLH